MQEPPDKSRTRTAVEVIVTGIASSVPVAGGLLGVALYEALNVSYNRRMSEFLEDVASKVDELISNEESLDISRIAADPSFQDAIFQASKAAASTTSKHKREQLRNAVINSIGVGAADLDLHMVLMRYVQELSPSHMALLVFLDDPKEYFRTHELPWADMLMGGLSNLIQEAFPEWNSESVQLFGRDLYARGLTKTDSFTANMTGAGLAASRTTQLGKSLLDLVRAVDTG